MIADGAVTSDGSAIRDATVDDAAAWTQRSIGDSDENDPPTELT